MSDLIIYMYPGACSRVTMTALEEAGVNYEDRGVDLGGGGQNTPEYVALNRKGKVPLIAFADGQTLTENAAILIYLNQRYPEAKLLPGSGDPIALARGQSDVIWCASTLHPIVRQIRAPFKWTLEDPRRCSRGRHEEDGEGMRLRLQTSGRRWLVERQGLVDRRRLSELGL